MKKLFKLSLLIITISLFFASCSDDDDNSDDDFVIESSALPKASQDLINDHFEAYTVTLVKQRYTPEDDTTFYTAYLTDGYKIDFNKNGDWVGLEGYSKELPSSLFGTEIPFAIKTYTDEKYPTERIKEIDKVSSGFKVELINDLDLFFSPTGGYLGLDD